MEQNYDWRDYLKLGGFECDVKTNINTGDLMLDQNNDLWVNPCPWSDGSNLKINTITSDPWNNYEVGIDYETMQEAIKRIVEEQFRKAGITPPDETEVQKIEKYKMKHK